MAFFSNGDQHYMSLSLDPAASDRAHLFKLSAKQYSVASAMLPTFFYIALGALALVLVLISFGSIGSDAQTEWVLGCGGLAMVIALGEVAYFGWVRRTSLRANDRERKNIGPLVVQKRVSWMAYATFLVALVTPFLGLAAVPGGLLTDTRSTDAATSFFLLNILVLGLALVAFLVWRIISLVR